MDFDIVEGGLFIDFGKKSGLSDDQIDGILEEVSSIIYRFPVDEGFHFVVNVDALKKALEDMWSEDDSHKNYFQWLDTLNSYQYVLI